MASASLTIAQDVATIVCDDTLAIATKDTGLTMFSGTIANVGSVTAFIRTSLSLATLPTTNAQITGVIPLPAGCSVRICHWMPGFGYKTASSSTVLVWIPSDDVSVI